MVAINVAQLLKTPTGETRTFDFDEPGEAFASDVALMGPLTGHVRLMRTARGILVSANYAARARVECARCLTDMETDVRGHFEEEALPSVNIRTGEWIPEVEGDQDKVRIDDHNVLDLDDLIRQDVLVSVPLRPLCDAACRGLCERCGNNRNSGACTCPADEETEPARPLGRLGEALERELQRRQQGA